MNYHSKKKKLSGKNYGYKMDGFKLNIYLHLTELPLHVQILAKENFYDVGEYCAYCVPNEEWHQLEYSFCLRLLSHNT